MGSITISGTTTNTPTSITWTASPSGETGTVTGDLVNFSTTVSISPDASGEGVETITFTATNGAGSDTDAVTVGFYVSGAHSWFSAQNINGTYNSGMVNLDAIAAWENLGSSALDVAQGTAGSRPTYRTSIVGGQPIVSFDGGDRLIASTASDWNFLSNLTDYTISVTANKLTDTNTYDFIIGTANGSVGSFLGMDYRSATTKEVFGYGGSRAEITSSQIGVFIQILGSYTNTGGVDATAYLNNSTTATASGTLTTVNTSPLILGGGDALFPFTGYIFNALIYSSVLTATQRAINLAVDEWALGGSLPLTP
jgi:hypothetical protein